jgi:NitT/TauT family transport system substrate-binding protein
MVGSIGLAATLLASACGSSGSPSSGSSSGPELTHLTVGVLPVTDDAPFFVAMKKGYFKQEGLSVTPKIIPQSTLAIPDMISGSIDMVAGANYVTFFSGAAKGTLKVSLVAEADRCTKDSLAVMALPKQHITSPAGLAGKTIAVNLTDNIQTLTINAVLKANDVNPAKVHYVVIPFPNMPAALAAGHVDTIATVEPFITGVEQADGAVPVLNMCQGPTLGLPVSGYFATQSWVQKNPKTAAAFRTAIEKGAAAADSNRLFVQQVLPLYTKITAKAAPLITLPQYPTTVDATQLQRVADLMKTAGMLSKPFNVNTIIFKGP